MDTSEKIKGHESKKYATARGSDEILRSYNKKERREKLNIHLDVAVGRRGKVTSLYRGLATDVENTRCPWRGRWKTNQRGGKKGRGQRERKQKQMFNKT